MKLISVRKANVHNLQAVDIDIPRDKLTVITGPSGSGKSSLAFDTIYAEGQRRYIESLSSYARQFLGQIEPPDVESITGLSPAIAIDQKTTSNNPRSTVGTVTEIYDYMRVLWARVGTPHCPETMSELKAQSAQQIVADILKFPKKSKLQILSPIIIDRKGEHKDDIAKFMALGFSKIRINGKVESLSDEIKINKNKRNTIEIVVDRIVVKDGIDSRLTESVEHALKFADGKVIINIIGDKDYFFSESLFSEKSKKSYPELEPKMFSFNSPLGACKSCNGLGLTKEFTLDKLIFDQTLPLMEGGMPYVSKKSFFTQMIKTVAKTEKIDLSVAYKKLPKKFLTLLFEGTDKEYNYKFESESSTFNFKKEFVGIFAWLQKKHDESASDKVRQGLEELMDIKTCSTCKGKRLNTYSLVAHIGKKDIMDICALPVDECLVFYKKLRFTGSKLIIAKKLLKEIIDRLGFLNEVGLKYLTLDRGAMTLSGGESQRIRLATQIGSALSGVLYVLDEPSIGLHQRDNDKLIKTLIALRDIGNTVLVVEHDMDTMFAADYLIDMGPLAGENGGKIVAKGTPAEVAKVKSSITGRYLSGKSKIVIPKPRTDFIGEIQLKGAKEHNLQSVDIKIPLGGLVCVTGVSGSGKSTLIHEVLTKAVKNILRRKTTSKKNYKSITGVDNIKTLIELDQSPIGRTPKSNPATYTGLLDDIRKLYASTNESKVRGYKQGRFSFNVKGGRCESCEGNGVIKVEMNFLPDVFVTCSHCSGKRYNQETLNITYRGKNIYDVLSMSVDDACEFFKNHRKLRRILDVMQSVGLGYIRLGQSSTTLSGGEAQRLKLSRELGKATRGHTLYVLDEPTTGLHFEDINVLLKAVNDLVDKGNTALIIEHNLDIIKCADYVIDLGPDGGKYGGQVIATGTPLEITKEKKSYTGKYLKKYLKK